MPKNTERGCLRVLFDIVDMDSPWCPSKASTEDLAALFQKLRDVSRMKPSEVFAGNSVGKDYAIDNGLPCNGANARLAELGFDDQDQISRLSIGGVPRLYGFRFDTEMYALWYDTKHEIWPSKLKHT